jgi:hypothetical protein
VIDMQGYEGVAFIGLFGTITGTGTPGIKVQQGDAANLSDAADLAGTANLMTDADSGKAVQTDIYRPVKRYCRPVATRATANAVLQCLIAIQYGARVQPPTHDSATIKATEVFASPAAGTA